MSNTTQWELRILFWPFGLEHRLGFCRRMFVIKEHVKITPGIVHDFIDWRSEELSGQKIAREWMIQHIDFPPITCVLTAWQNCKKPRKSLLELGGIMPSL
jgi:hypothetical protein